MTTVIWAKKMLYASNVAYYPLHKYNILVTRQVQKQIYTNQFVRKHKV